MLDWFLLEVYEFGKALLAFVVGSYILFKWILPKMTSSTAIATAEAIINHPKIQPTIKKLKQYEKELSPLIEKAKQVDIQELVDMLKGLKVFIKLQTNKNEPPPPPSREG